MKIVKRMAAAALILVVVLVVASLFLPRHAVVSRSAEIAAPAAAVFPFVGDLRRFTEWSPWLERDPAVRVTFTGPTDGVGQTLNWASDKPDVGSGSMTIRRIEPDREVAMLIDFGSQGTAAATIVLAPAGAATRVTWSVDTDLGFDPISRYMGLMMDGLVGPDCEKGLATLKAVAEAAPAAN